MGGRNDSLKRGLLGKTWEELVEKQKYYKKANLAELLGKIAKLDETYKQEQEEYNRVCGGDNVVLKLLDDFNDHKTGNEGNDCNILTITLVQVKSISKIERLATILG